MANKERDDLARYLLQHSADDNAPQLTAEAQAWAEKEVVRILQAEKEAYEAREDAIANALGLPDSWKARSDFPILNAIRIQRERIERLEAALLTLTETTRAYLFGRRGLTGENAWNSKRMQDALEVADKMLGDGKR